MGWWLKEGLAGVQEPLVTFDDFAGSILEITATLAQALDQALDKILPPLSEQLTKLYNNLTEQRSFERVRIEKQRSPEQPIAKAPQLFIRVWTERDPGRFWDPESVLNGQALKAIQLAPYFVFSSFEAEALELDLLMLDDPSQSFDSGRVNLLLKELGNAASHAQVIVATQEPERFYPHLQQYFPVNECLTRTVKMSEPIEGPFLE